MRPKRRSRAEWRALVEKLRASGQSRETFARRHGLKASTLGWWASELRHETSASTAPTFVALEVIEGGTRHEQASTDRGIGVVERGSVRFVVGSDADPRRVAALIVELGRC